MKNTVRVVIFISGIVNLILGIYDDNFTAAMGWAVASVYMGLDMVGGLIIDN